ncbi:hypothetical protein IWX50DRAFT_617499 [Phyllosticta citricarpa]
MIGGTGIRLPTESLWGANILGHRGKQLSIAAQLLAQDRARNHDRRDAKGRGPDLVNGCPVVATTKHRFKSVGDISLERLDDNVEIVRHGSDDRPQLQVLSSPIAVFAEQDIGLHIVAARPTEGPLVSLSPSRTVSSKLVLSGLPINGTSGAKTNAGLKRPFRNLNKRMLNPTASNAREGEEPKPKTLMNKPCYALWNNHPVLALSDDYCFGNHLFFTGEAGTVSAWSARATPLGQDHRSISLEIRVVDVGGGEGQVAICLADRFSHLSFVVQEVFVKQKSRPGRQTELVQQTALRSARFYHAPGARGNRRLLPQALLAQQPRRRLRENPQGYCTSFGKKQTGDMLDYC